MNEIEESIQQTDFKNVSVYLLDNDQEQLIEQEQSIQQIPIDENDSWEHDYDDMVREDSNKNCLNESTKPAFDKHNNSDHIVFEMSEKIKEV